MKKIIAFIAAGLVLVLLACSGEKNTTAGRPKVIVRGDTTVKDSIEFYKTDFEGRQGNDKAMMTGKWQVVTMRRQARAELEQLSRIYIEFSGDTSFTGNAGCNRMRGIYTVKGTSVGFSNILTTKMACDIMEKETAFLNLLQNTVSAYTISETKMLLRDGSSNIIFELEREN